MPRAFVIRPFGQKKDSSNREIDFDRAHRELIGPALLSCGLGGGTTGEIVEAGNIREDMFALIFEADVVVADITILNANVFYELGIRHALRKKCTVLIKGQPTTDSTPFDLLTDRYLPYDIENPGGTKVKLIETINASLKTDRQTDSPIFQMLPALPEADPSKVQVVPFDFREDVERAGVAKSKGWLRLLSDEVRNQRFQWSGLKLVARAQWDLKDWEGARQSWESIREIRPKDPDANLALANIFERQYRSQNQPKPELLAASDHAIERVLADDTATHDQRVEALSLAGRNRKTRWRLQFENLETVERRRQAAANQTLRQSYEEYMKAFYHDLNHFYSGLAALQMGTILADLSTERNWADAFGSDTEAAAYLERLQKEVNALRLLVPTSVHAGLQRMNQDVPNRVWAEISSADVLFLTEEGRPRRVVSAYAAAIPLDKPFAWDAARGQLELFAKLGVKADLAKTVIDEMTARIEQQNAAGTLSPGTVDKQIHLFVFGGHRVDAANRTERRFPPEREEQAKEMIRERIEGLLDQQYRFIGLGSAAPGADILAHEVCAELGLKTTICLPMPAKDYARLQFDDLDGWRKRFLDLAAVCEVLELSDQAGLPRWLHASKVDPWERGNRWVIQLALAWGAQHVTLVALWDGKPAGDAPGGTAQLVQLARDCGVVDVITVDAKCLLA